MKDDHPSLRRLNPFAFPPETNVRFVLVILAVCMMAISISQPLNIITRLAIKLSQGVSLNEAMAPTDFDPSIYPSDEGFEINSIKSEALSGVGEQIGRLILPFIVILIMFFVAAFIYRKHPDRICRRKKLIPLAGDKSPLLHQRVGELANQINLPAPNLMLGEGLRSQNGQAFGVGNEMMLGLGGGVRLLMVKAPARFRALIFHEFAHIANRDIFPTYFSEALWRAAIYVVVVPFVVIVLGLALFSFIATLLSGDIIGILLLMVFNVFGILVLLVIFGLPLAFIFFTRAGLLRIREVYADWRASQWGAERPLLEILKAGATKEVHKRGLRFHPTAKERLRTLIDPTGLYRMRMDLPLIVGILFALVVAGLYTYFSAIAGIFLSLLMASIADLVEEAFSSTSIFFVQIVDLAISVVGLLNNAFVLVLVFGVSVLVAGTVGLQIQRETVAALGMRTKDSAWLVRLGAAAVLITVGIEIGFLIAPPYLLSPLGALIGGLIDPLLLLLIFPWLMIFTLFTLLALLYARFSTRSILCSHIGSSPPKRKLRLLTFFQSIAFCALFFPLMVGRINILYQTDQLYVSVFYNSLIAGVLIYIVLFVATWLVIQVKHIIRPARCPSCSNLTRHRVVIGQNCEHCSHDLASWLFTEPTPIKKPANNTKV